MKKIKINYAIWMLTIHELLHVLVNNLCIVACDEMRVDDYNEHL